MIGRNDDDEDDDNDDDGGDDDESTESAVALRRGIGMRARAGGACNREGACLDTKADGATQRGSSSKRS